jgi:acyl-CoA synthetase (NDP forming)
MTQLSQAIFRPRAIALVGASADAGKHSALPQRHLLQHGYAGELYPINPRRAQIQGLKAYPSVSAVPTQVDHAYIMLPTEHVLAAARDCVSAGVRCMTIMSNGFAEAGREGQERQAELLEILSGSQTRLLGPNALGVVDLHAKVALSANEVLSLPELPAGDVALVSQSGSMLGAILSRGAARGVGFSKLVSVGNEADISVAELVDMLVDDPHTAVIQLFIETIRFPEALRAGVARAAKAGKPVLAYRLGRSALGQQLAVSHTGALTGSGKAASAFLRDIGVAELRNLDALLDAPPLFREARPTGSRVAVMSTTGGGGALVVDNLGERELVVTAPPEPVRRRLAEQGIEVSDAPLVDLTLAGTNPTTYGAVMREFLASDEIDTLVAVVGSSSQFRPERAVAPILESRSGKPLAVFLTPNAERSQRLLREAGIAVFSQPEACADALSAWTNWQPPRCLETVSATAASEQLRRHPPGATLNAVDAQAVFASLGIPQVREWVLGAEPEAWSREDVAAIPFPCVLKISSRDVPHKTEVGGVRLGINGAEDLRSAAQAMRKSVAAAAPQARLEGFQVQETVRGLAEVLVGFSRDATVGPIVSVGMGGVLAELYQDVSIRPAPVDLREAHAMIQEVRAFAALAGYRNLPRGDMNALARTISQVSTLCAAEPEVAEAEINPVVVLPEGHGVRALDGLVVLR